YKGKLEGMRARPHGVVAMPWNHSIVIEAFAHVNGEAANGHAAADNGASSPQFNVVKTEKFHAQPMTVSDAIMQLNLLNEPFLVFRQEQDGKVAVVYKRDDGSYGLIETPAGAA